jgi:putative ABC transport system substrate-binding protein
MARLDRRRFLHNGLALTGLSLLGGCGVPFAPAASPARLRRIGYLETRGPTPAAPTVELFRQGLRDLGYVEGQHIAIEFRYVDGSEEALPGLAAELVGLPMESISVPASSDPLQPGGSGPSTRSAFSA